MPQFDLNILSTQNINLLFSFCLSYLFYIKWSFFLLYYFKLPYKVLFIIYLYYLNNKLVMDKYFSNLLFIFFNYLKKIKYFFYFFSKGNRSSLYLYLNIFIFILIFLVFLISGCTLTDEISFCTNLLGKTEIEISNSTSTFQELETTNHQNTSQELETTNHQNTSQELETTNSWGFWSWAAVAAVAAALVIVTLIIYNTDDIGSCPIAHDPGFSTWETPVTVTFPTGELNPIDVVVDELNRLSEDEMSKEEIEEFHRIYYELIETEENKLD